MKITAEQAIVNRAKIIRKCRKQVLLSLEKAIVETCHTGKTATFFTINRNCCYKLFRTVYLNPSEYDELLACICASAVESGYDVSEDQYKLSIDWSSPRMPLANTQACISAREAKKLSSLSRHDIIKKNITGYRVDLDKHIRNSSKNGQHSFEYRIFPKGVLKNHDADFSERERQEILSRLSFDLVQSGFSVSRVDNMADTIAVSW